jgi:hypothetical protein
MPNELNLIPDIKPGEYLTIQRSVRVLGQSKPTNVLLFVEAVDGCDLNQDRVRLKAKVKSWGASSFADGRVAQQHASINRLLEERSVFLGLLREAARIIAKGSFAAEDGKRADSWTEQAAEVDK